MRPGVNPLFTASLRPRPDHTPPSGASSALLSGPPAPITQRCRTRVRAGRPPTLGGLTRNTLLGDENAKEGLCKLISRGATNGL